MKRNHQRQPRKPNESNHLRPRRNGSTTAEKVAKRYRVTREEQDAFALESQRRAAAAIRDGVFQDEIVPVEVPRKGAAPLVVTADEHPRPDLSLDALAALRPAFAADGTVTAGNSSGINDGASALLLVAGGTATSGRPLARVVATAVAGVDPSVMGLGPIPATRKVLNRAGLRAGFSSAVGSQEYLRRLYGLDRTGVVAQALKLLGKK